MNDFCADAFLDFLNRAHSVYHAAAAVSALLEQAGYEKLSEREAWDLRPGGRYYLTRGNACAAAFRIPEGTPAGFLITAAHADRPALKLKEHGELTGAYTRLAVEVYGGALLFPWTDRPLSAAGRVFVRTPAGAEARLVDLDRDLFLIPNVAIHMNPGVNDGYKWNPGVDLVPLAGTKNAAGSLRRMLEEQAGGEILGHDLYLYVRQPAAVWGAEGDMVSAQGLDDLQCVWSTLQGFLAAPESGSIPLFCAFNSEEVGSRTRDGADSTLLEELCGRIAETLGADVRRLLSQSFVVSADNAHALHPNHPELADSANAPVLGGGPVLKFNAAQRYSTDGLSAAVFRTVCGRAGVSVQTFCNRPDMKGGSTLGHVSIAHVSVPTADVGLPQLAMHSCYETASVSDTAAMVRAMTVYFGSTLTLDETGFRLD